MSDIIKPENIEGLDAYIEAKVRRLLNERLLAPVLTQEQVSALQELSNYVDLANVNIYIQPGHQMVITEKNVGFHTVNRPKRVLLYAPTVGRGGVRRVVETLTAAWATLTAKGGEWDYDFEVLGQTFDEIGNLLHWPEQWPFTQLEPGADIPPHPHQFNWLMKHQDNFVRHLKRVVETGRYDLVFCPSPWWTMRPQTEVFELPVPFVTVVADFAFDHINMGGMSANFRYVARQVAEKADLTIFPSYYQRRWGEKHYGFQQTRTIEHSADFVANDFQATFEEGQRVREKYGLPERYILAMHCMYHKDPVTILKAHSFLKDAPPLVMAGVGTQYLANEGKAPDGHIEQVRQAVIDTGHAVGQNLFIPGFVPDEDIAGLYMNAAVAVSASLSEGDLSGMCFEAMLASAPLVVSDLEVFTDRLGTDGQYALVFSRGVSSELAARISEVLEKPEEARQRATAAFGYANQRTALDVATAYLEAFEHVLNHA